VSDRSELDQFLGRLSTEFPDARHICYAAVIGPPETGQQLYRKLGSGGLVRAYSSSASGSVMQLNTRIVEQTAHLRVQADFPLENNIRHLFSEFGIESLDVHYEHNLQIDCHVPVTLLPSLRDRLTDITRGKIDITVRE